MHTVEETKNKLSCKYITLPAVVFFIYSLGLNPLTAKLFNLNFHPLEVVSR